MRNTILASLLVIMFLALQLFPGAERAAAQDLGAVKWALHEVRINPAKVLASRTYERWVSMAGGEKKAKGLVTTGASAGSMFYAESVKDLDGNELWSYSYTFDFASPPAEFVTNEKFEISVNGNAVIKKQAAGVSGPYNYIGGVSVNVGLADNQGNFTSRPSDKWLEVGDRTSNSESMQVPVLGRYAKTGVPLSDQYFRIDVSTGLEFETEQGDKGSLQVAWIYQAVETIEEQPPKTSAPAATTPDEPEETPAPEPSPAVIENKPETPRERMERAIAQNLVDYIDMNKKFEKDLKPLYDRADAIMEDLRDAQWFLAHGTDADKKQAEKDIARLQDEMKKLMDEFNIKAAVLEDVLDGIESRFVGYEQKQELKETLDGYWSQLSLMRINLALRSGNVEEFDKLFHEYRDDENIADQVLVGNAFRRLMAGDTRTALESVKLALAEDSENPTARQLLQNLETYYLDIIRDKVAGERSQNAKLFNDKLNGHGQEGVGSFLLDVLTTGTGESFQALAAYMEIYDNEGTVGLARAGYQAVAEGKYPKGYYDFLQEISSLNIDEATAQIAGIQFVKDLRQHGVTLDEMSTMTVPGLQQIVRERFDGRDLSEEQATVLRKRIWDAFKNPDVDVLRKGEKMQLDVDAGRNYFDTEVLEASTSDIIMKQFSAWDTFLTFAPSAQLGNVSKLGVAQRLGLKAETTLQQGLQKGLKIEELGHRLYQTESGAAVIDGMYEWSGFTEMVSQAVKKRVGDVAYATGSAAVQAAISQMSAPAGTALKNELLEISDYYLGGGTTATVEATVDTMGSFFGFIGLNAQALQRGAYGVEDLEQAREKIQAELTQRRALADNAGIAEVSSRPVDFAKFEDQVAQQGESYLTRLRDARDRVQGAAQGLGGRRGTITSQADEALEQMEEAAAALRQGDRAGAQKIFESMQSSSGRNFDFMNQENLRKLGGATDTMRMIEALQSKTPTDRDFAAEIAKKVMSPANAPGSEAAELKALTDVLTAASLQGIPE